MSSVIQTYKRYDFSFTKGEGAYLFTDKKEKFIDFCCGISVVNLGHSHKEISKVICEQSKRIIHTSNLYQIEEQEQLAEKIANHGFNGETFFCNSGAEANEAALKIARIIGNKKFNGEKYKIITMNNSFHGRTFNTLSATGQYKIKVGFEPVFDNFIHCIFNNFNELVKKTDKNVIAIMLELIQGEGGLAVAEKEYIKKIRKFCNDKDILFIIDEVQTAIGRTGKLFAYEHFGIEPDIMTLAKALGNGIPIGAVCAKKEFAEYLSFGTHGSTFGGNFLSCAVANKVIDIISDKNFLSQVNEKAIYLRNKLKNIFENQVKIKGIGLMLGIEFNNIINTDFIDECHKQKLLLIPAGENTVRIYPPLNIDNEIIDEAITIMKKAYGKLK
jgi:predicted acetylornithine/succinylornithine family transaminase